MSCDADLSSIAAAADLAFPDGFEMAVTVEGTRTHGSLNLGDARKVVQLIDEALRKTPHDTNLMMAKAGALARMLQMKSAEDVIDEVLGIDPDCLDAKMRKRHWDKWPLLFDFPSWDESDVSSEVLYRTTLGRLRESHAMMYLARTGLKLGVVIVQSVDGLVFRNGIDPKMRGMVQVLIVETPYGPIAPFYVLLDDHSDSPVVRETVLTTSKAHSPVAGLWLLHRLAFSSSYHLVFVRGSDVVYNKRIELLAEQVKMLRDALPILEQSQLTMDLNQIQRALQWHTETFSLSNIRFP